MASEFYTIARPYAKAAFEYAREQNQIEPWARELQIAAAACADNDFVALLANPKASREQRVLVLEAVGGKEFSPAFIQYLKQLAERDRLAILPEIAELYALALAEHQRSQAVDVFSVLPLAAEQQQRLQASLNKRLQRTVTIQYYQEPSLLGGLIIKAGDWEMDGSVRNQLQNLTQQLIA
jgi:F-type H+-transporting ATPase subunit delta